MTTINTPANFKNAHNARRVRKGKTTKDKESGSWSSRFANRDARVAWQKDSKNAVFPQK
jgi:hypothetical protein